MGKITYRIPTGDDFAFIEIESDLADEFDIVGKYHDLIQAFKPKTGLPDKEWRELIDTYLWTNDGINSEEYALLNKEQQWMVQEVKKSKKRELYKVLQREQDEVNHIKSIQGEDV